MRNIIEIILLCCMLWVFVLAFAGVHFAIYMAWREWRDEKRAKK